MMMMMIQRTMGFSLRSHTAVAAANRVFQEKNRWQTSSLLAAFPRSRSCCCGQVMKPIQQRQRISQQHCQITLTEEGFHASWAASSSALFSSSSSSSSSSTQNEQSARPSKEVNPRKQQSQQRQPQHQHHDIILNGLNDRQEQAVTLPHQSMARVLAGPGSGKTKVLTCRIAWLLKQQQTQQNRFPPQVLAVTFTRKAAGEMQQRVEQLLTDIRVEQQGQQEENEYQQQQVQREEDIDPSLLEASTYNSDRIIDENQSTKSSSQANAGLLNRVTVGTFHSVCARILRFNGDLLANLPSVQQDVTTTPALNGNFAIVDASDQLRILKECLDEAKIDLKSSGTKPKQILSALSRIKEKRAHGDSSGADDQKKKLSISERVATQVYRSYRERLLMNNAADFDDLIYMTRELLLQHSDLRERLHQRWPHVLVDEFQDTSRTQMDLVKLLTSKSLFVVGDADQSIYSWRGAHVGSMHDFVPELQDYAGPEGVVTVALQANYRSTSNIVNAAEKVISSSGHQTDKTTTELRRSMTAARGSGPSPRVVACNDERAEASFVVDTILTMLEDGSLPSTGSSAAIIYRTNAQSRYLEEACVRKNLPYVIRGGAGGFYNRAEIKDSLCFLRWLANGNNDGAMIRAMRTPSKGIGPKALEEFQDYADEIGSFYKESERSPKPTKLDILISMTDDEAVTAPLLAEGSPEASLFISKRAVTNLLSFSRKMRAIRDKAHTAPIDAVLYFLLEELNLIEYFDSISESKSVFNERQQNVQELRKAAKRFTPFGAALKKQQLNSSLSNNYGTSDMESNESPLMNFLDDVALVTDIAEDEDSKTSDGRLVVNLMTIHGSKGMEFDSVFVVGNEEGTLPTSQAIQEGVGSVVLEEEKRLCYVAMTRAKTSLILTWRKEVTSFSAWNDFGSKARKMERSRFLDALVINKKKGTSVGKNGEPSRSRSPPRGVRPKAAHLPAATSTRQLAGGKPTSPWVSNRSNTSSMKRRQSPLSLQRGSPSRNGASVPGSLGGKPQPRTGQRQPPRGRSPERISSRVDRQMKVPSTRSRDSPEKTNAPGSSKNSRSKRPKETAAVDSTWFFPVGSSVVHGNFGTGVVLQPPPSTNGEAEMLVRVEFSDGRTRDFPASSDDLSPDLGI